jgi:hypothetical protein
MMVVGIGLAVAGVILGLIFGFAIGAVGYHNSSDMGNHLRLECPDRFPTPDASGCARTANAIEGVPALLQRRGLHEFSSTLHRESHCMASLRVGEYSVDPLAGIGPRLAPLALAHQCPRLGRALGPRHSQAARMTTAARSTSDERGLFASLVLA